MTYDPKGARRLTWVCSLAVAAILATTPAIAQDMLLAPNPPLRSHEAPATLVESPQPASGLPVPEPTSLLDRRVPPTLAELTSGPVAVEPVVAFALANNPEIQAACFNARALASRVPQVTTLPDPQLMTLIFLESIQTAAGPQELSLSLSQQFPWFGKLALRGDVASREAAAAFCRVVVEELRVMEQVQRQYYAIYFFDRAIETTRALERPLKDIVESARTRYETAVGGGLESVLQAQVELSNLQARLIELRQQKDEAQARLAGLLHLPPYVKIETLESIQLESVAEAENLVGLVSQCQPELNARRQEIARDQASVALARRQYYPDVMMTFNWYAISEPGLSPVANGEDAFALGVGANLPIYRKRLDAAVREAQFRAAQSTQRYAAAVDQYSSEVLALYNQFVQHQEVLDLLEKEIIPRAEQTLELSVEGYRVGRVTFQQMIANYQALLNFRIQRYQRQMLREQTVASLQRAVGCAISTPGALEPTQPGNSGESLPAPLPEGRS